MQSSESVAEVCVCVGGGGISLVAMGERTMNKFIAVPRRLPSIMKHKVSVLQPCVLVQNYLPPDC